MDVWFFVGNNAPVRSCELFVEKLKRLRKRRVEARGIGREAKKATCRSCELLVRIQQASRSGHDMVEERQPEEPESASRQMKHEGIYFERVD